MRQISLVGAVDEEVGDYFPEFLDMLEESPFLKVRAAISDGYSAYWIGRTLRQGSHLFALCTLQLKEKCVSALTGR